VDTPGFDDTHKSDVDVLKMIADWLKSTYVLAVMEPLTWLMYYFCRYSKGILLSGLLYFHRISDNRMAGTPLKNLRMFEKLCGKNAFQNVILVTTMWDEVDEETGTARETELKSNHWRAMLDRNCTTSRFMRTRESAFALIDPLIDEADKRSSVLLQQEMGDMRKKLPQTSAGLALFSTLEILVRQREDLLHRIRNEMKYSDNDKMVLEPLQEEHQKLKSDLQLTVNEMRRLRLPLGKRLAKKTEYFFSSVLMCVIPRPSKDPLTGNGDSAVDVKNPQNNPIYQSSPLPTLPILYHDVNSIRVLPKIDLGEDGLMGNGGGGGAGEVDEDNGMEHRLAFGVEGEAGGNSVSEASNDSASDSDDDSSAVCDTYVDIPANQLVLSRPQRQ
jgi:hypothetical protein